MKRDRIVVIAGLPRDILRWTTDLLASDSSLKPAKYIGAPASKSNMRPLYGLSNVAETLRLIENEGRNVMPNRIIVLYVPSTDAVSLITALDFVCFLAPLDAGIDGNSDGATSLDWRHNRQIVRNTVYETLHNALKATDSLKREITDKRISALTLPARNFHYPKRDSTIASTYKEFILRNSDLTALVDDLKPRRFTRNQLPQKAFKGRGYRAEFFQDMRGRIFPPDLFHANAGHIERISTNSRLSLALRQRYRFGVIVRDGNLHYDVQYELGRTLNNEAMHCAAAGDVSVTGSHANVGVNDVVWVPNGKKIPTKQ